MRRLALALVAAASACSTVLGLDPGQPREDAAVEAGVEGGGADDAAHYEAAPGDDGAPAPDAPAHDEAGGDASARDAAPPPPRSEPQIECGDASCVPGMTKCVLSCGAGAQLNCQPWQAPLTGCAIALCDDPAECTAAGACCARPPSVVADVISGASCRPDCGDAGDVRLCDPGKHDCPSGSCKPYFGYFACQ